MRFGPGSWQVKDDMVRMVVTILHVEQGLYCLLSNLYISGFQVKRLLGGVPRLAISDKMQPI